MLSRAEIERMRAEHVERWSEDHCATCCQCESVADICFPCDAARLLEHFAPGPVAHLAGIANGLFGPTSTEELPCPKS